MTSDTDFKVTTFFDIEYLRNDTRIDRAIVTIEHQYEVVRALCNGDISNDLDGPLTRFLGHSFFEVEYLKNCAFKDNVTKEH